LAATVRGAGEGKKLVYRRFGSIDPFLMTAVVIVCFVAAADEHGGSATLTFAAAGCFAIMLAMRLALNMLVNLGVFRRGEEGGDPDRWRQLHRRWDRIHTVPVLLDGACCALVAGAVVWH
jgi:hypothetical protein